MRDECKFTYEVYSDSTDIAFCVCVISKSQQETRFSNAWIADQQQFEEIITAKINKWNALVCGTE